MTAMQAKCLGLLESWFRDHRHAPTYDEIAAGLGDMSKSNAFRIVKGLEEGGYLTRRSYRERSIRLTVLPVAGDPAPLVQAARRLLDTIKVEKPEDGYALVGSAALGDLDLALADMEAAASHA